MRKTDEIVMLCREKTADLCAALRRISYAIERTRVLEAVHPTN